jgi:hypothetical protein
MDGVDEVDKRKCRLFDRLRAGSSGAYPSGPSTPLKGRLFGHPPCQRGKLPLKKGEEFRGELEPGDGVEKNLRFHISENTYM